MSGWRPGTVTDDGEIRGFEHNTFIRSGVAYIKRDELHKAKAAGWKERSVMANELAMVER